MNCIYVYIQRLAEVSQYYRYIFTMHILLYPSTITMQIISKADSQTECCNLFILIIIRIKVSVLCSLFPLLIP